MSNNRFNKFIPIITLVLLLTLFSAKATSVMSPETFTTTVILNDYYIKKSDNITITYLQLANQDQEYTSILSPRCRIYDDKKNRITVVKLLNSYMKRYIKINFILIPKGTMIVSINVL